MGLLVLKYIQKWFTEKIIAVLLKAIHLGENRNELR